MYHSTIKFNGHDDHCEQIHCYLLPSEIQATSVSEKTLQMYWDPGFAGVYHELV